MWECISKIDHPHHSLFVCASPAIPSQGWILSEAAYIVQVAYVGKGFELGTLEPVFVLQKNEKIKKSALMAQDGKCTDKRSTIKCDAM